jgi:hypothetical protein
VNDLRPFWSSKKLAYTVIFFGLSIIAAKLGERDISERLFWAGITLTGAQGLADFGKYRKSASLSSEE